MSNLVKIQPFVEVKVPAYFDDEREVDVKIIFRVSDDGFIFFSPMQCFGSIHKNKTLQELRNQFVVNYENQGYKIVETKEVYICKDFLNEYKADAKITNKKESENLTKFIHEFIDKSPV